MNTESTKINKKANSLSITRLLAFIIVIENLSYLILFLAL